MITAMPRRAHGGGRPGLREHRASSHPRAFAQARRYPVHRRRPTVARRYRGTGTWHPLRHRHARGYPLPCRRDDPARRRARRDGLPGPLRNRRQASHRGRIPVTAVNLHIEEPHGLPARTPSR
jgi:hypothetical protein